MRPDARDGHRRRPSTTSRCTTPTAAGGSRPGRPSARSRSDVSGRLLRLPFHNKLTDRDLDRVVDALVAAPIRSGSAGDRATVAAGLVVGRRSPTTGGTAPAPTCSRAALRRLPRRPRAACSTSAARTRPAWRGCGATTSTSRRPGPPRACGPARASARPRLALPFAGRDLRRGRRRSTWSSTASREPARWPSWRGCSRPAGGCCCPCRPTSGRGPTTTSGPVTTAATRGPRLVAAVEGAGMQVERATYAFGGVFPLFAAERLRRRLRPPAAGRPGSRRSRRALDRVLMGLCRAEARVLRRRDLPFGSSVFLVADKPGRRPPGPEHRRRGHREQHRRRDLGREEREGDTFDRAATRSSSSSTTAPSERRRTPRQRRPVADDPARARPPSARR